MCRSSYDNLESNTSVGRGNSQARFYSTLRLNVHTHIKAGKPLFRPWLIWEMLIYPSSGRRYYKLNQKKSTQALKPLRNSYPILKYPLRTKPALHLRILQRLPLAHRLTFQPPRGSHKSLLHRLVKASTCHLLMTTAHSECRPHPFI